MNVLAPVEHPVIPVSPAGGGQSGDIGSCPGLGEAERAPARLALLERREEALLLRRAAELADGWAARVRARGRRTVTPRSQYDASSANRHDSTPPMRHRRERLLSPSRFSSPVSMRGALTTPMSTSSWKNGWSAGRGCDRRSASMPSGRIRSRPSHESNCRRSMCFGLETQVHHAFSQAGACSHGWDGWVMTAPAASWRASSRPPKS